MRHLVLALCGALLLYGCGPNPPNPYPDSAHAQFSASCPPDSAVCSCTWDRITRDMTYDQYDEAVHHFRESGLMDPRITHARTFCIEHNPQH